MTERPEQPGASQSAGVRIRGNWLTGNLFEFLRTPLGFYERAAACGDIVFGRLAHMPICVLSHPRQVEQVLVRDTDAFEQSIVIRRSLKLLLGDGLLISQKESSARQRPLVIQALHSGVEAFWANAVVGQAESLADSWSAGESRDIYATMLRMVSDFMHRVTFGINIDTPRLGAVVESGTRRAEDFPPIPQFIPTRRNLAQRKSIREMDHVLFAAIRAERAAPSGNRTLLSELAHTRGEDGSMLSDRAVRDQIVMIYVAVLQNMAAALTWTFSLLSRNPRCYEEVRTEVALIAGNRAPTMAEVTRMIFCKNTIKEALRLYPPVWQIFRQLNRDTQIDGCKLRAGTQAIFSQWVLQRDARFFAEPEKFLPHRWENPQPEWKFAYFPFGAGPRACIGQELCFLSVTLILAVFTQKFHFAPLPDAGSPEVDPAFALRPRAPLLLQKQTWSQSQP
jgi:cytochrome P450